MDIDCRVWCFIVVDFLDANGSCMSSKMYTFVIYRFSHFPRAYDIVINFHSTIPVSSDMPSKQEHCI